MAAVGLPIWTPDVWADTLWAAGVWQDETAPPPPPPPEVDEVLSGGWGAHGARWRGFKAPPRRQAEDEDDNARGQELEALAAAGTGLVTPAPPVAELAPLLATAIAVDPGPDWAWVLRLARADVSRRQALAAQAEEEEMLVLLLLLEVL